MVFQLGNQYAKGHKLSQAQKEVIRQRMLGNTQGFKKNKSSWNKGTKGLMNTWNKGKKTPQNTGQNHWKWKGGVKNRDIHSLYNPKYVEWRNSVFSRDKWKCRIADENCRGQLEAHHILAWRDYPELRYAMKNGITLCHHHHPRKRVDELRLSPFFQEIIDPVVPHLT